MPTQKDVFDMSKNNSIIFTDEIDVKKREPKLIEELPPRDINGL
jgi:hypothetical protein